MRMTDAHGRKHHGLQIKEKPSKAGSFTGLLLKLFNWNGWLLRKGVPKKLPSAERPQDSKNCSKDERLPMPTLVLVAKRLQISNERSASSSTISRTDDPYGAVQTIAAEDGIHLRKAGVVARLMGLDYIPCSQSKMENTDAHQQAILPSPTGKRQYFKSKEAKLTAKTFDNSSKKVNVNQHLQQRQLARSLDINLQKISRNSFLNYASKPVCQQEDIQKINISRQVSSHRSHSNSPPSKSSGKLRSTQKNTGSKRATLLLEAAVKTLEPNFQSGNHDRPVLVQALASRTANPKIREKRINLERRDDGRNCHNDNIGVPRKGSAINSTTNLPSHTKFCCSQEERGAWQMSLLASRQESQKLRTSTIQARHYCSDQHQSNKVGVEGVMKKGHHGQLHVGTNEHISQLKPKIVKEMCATSQQPDRKIVHNEFEEATAKTNDRLHKTGCRKTPMLTAKDPTNSTKSKKLNTKQYPLKHEDDELSVRLINPCAETNVENEPKMTEASHTEKMSTSSRNSRPGRDRRSGEIHKEILTWNEEEADIKGASQASQEKTLPTRRALADFSLERNQNDSNTKHKSLSNTSAGRYFQKSRYSKSSSRGTEELGVTLASCTEKSKSQIYSQLTAENQGLVLEIDGPHLSTESEKCLEEYAVNETTNLDRPLDASYGGNYADDLDNVDVLPFDRKYLVSRHCETLFLEKTKEKSPQISKTEIFIRTQDKLCAEHPGDELQNEKDPRECSLKDHDLEEILKGMLSMTIASDSSNEEDYKKDICFLSQDCPEACNDKLEVQSQSPLQDEPRATSVTLEIRSPPPPESTVSTPRCAENVSKPDIIEDCGQPSPVSVLQLPFEDEDMCSWNGEACTEKVMDALHSRPALAPRGNTISQSTCNINLLGNPKSRNREMIQEAILYNLQQHFLDLLTYESTDSNDIDYIEYKVDDANPKNLLLLQDCDNTSCSNKVRRLQCQQLHQFATTENTCASKQGYPSRRSEASKFHDKLLSDCAKEALRPKLSNFRYDDLWCQPSFVELTAIGRQIVHEACKQILVWSQLNLSTINDLVDRDLSLPAENWTDSRKVDEIGAKIESAIYDAILEELVYDLSTSDQTTAS
ncbi:hypothetical protein O6H91_01G164800 [Diphasiastrum complanatum]|uniref:Uncharacterized protein n=1 Tax=Diphasiastrum complanatum TaxID=34168 RepID=A0ACC2EYA0_DIPCM|nr:hypothetical protein O6H91_01G164800 [Diphasiastrum complanatum]